MSRNEILDCVIGPTRPGDEVVDRGTAMEPHATVEAVALLQLSQPVPQGWRKCSSFRTEEVKAQVILDRA